MGRRFSELRAQIISCEECYFRNPEIVPLAPAEVAPPVTIMFVGENPSWQVGQLVPFDTTTISGQSLEANYLTPLGLTRGQVWITDLFKCRYPKPVYGEKKKAEPRVQSEVVAACTRWLVEEIAYARPSVIVTLSDSRGTSMIARQHAKPCGPPNNSFELSRLAAENADGSCVCWGWRENRGQPESATSSIRVH